MLQSFTTQCRRQWRGIFSGCIMCSLDALFIFFFQFSATEWTVTTRALAVSNSLACIHMLILVHQQECMVGHCNAWTVSYWYICMSLTTSPPVAPLDGSAFLDPSAFSDDSSPFLPFP